MHFYLLLEDKSKARLLLQLCLAGAGANPALTAHQRPGLRAGVRTCRGRRGAPAGTAPRSGPNKPPRDTRGGTARGSQAAEGHVALAAPRRGAEPPSGQHDAWPNTNRIRELGWGKKKRRANSPASLLPPASRPPFSSWMEEELPERVGKLLASAKAQRYLPFYGFSGLGAELGPDRQSEETRGSRDTPGLLSVPTRLAVQTKARPGIAPQPQRLCPRAVRGRAVPGAKRAGGPACLQFLSPEPHNFRLFPGIKKRK